MDNIQDFARKHKTFVSFIVVLAVLLYAKNLPQTLGVVKEASDQRVDTSPTAQPTVSLTPTPTPHPEAGQPLTETPTAKPTATPHPTSTPAAAGNISDFFYPGATQMRLEGNTLVLESIDNPDAITNWYKNKINSLGMNAKAFVMTKANGNVENKLAGDNGTLEVEVEIKKKASETKTTITVKLETS